MQTIKDNGLSLFFGGIFLATLVAQAVAGHAAFNNEQLQHGGDQISLASYVVSAQYGAAVLENWQSEYLQFTLFILLTVWLLQRGSPESKELDKAGLESDEDQEVGEHAGARSPRWARLNDWRRRVYENSLLLVMGTIWVGTWFAHSVTGWSAYNAEQLEHEQDKVSWLDYVGSAEFWEATLQNWQSEFLAVGSFAVLAIYLRQRGSPESKPVGAAHDATGVEG